MSVRSIREYHGKKIINRFLDIPYEAVLVTQDVLDKTQSLWVDLVDKNQWLKEEGLRVVAKPDQLIKRRGKQQLISLNTSLDVAREWIEERMNKDLEIETLKGKLTHFIIEKFIPHKQEDEYYLCFQSHRYCDQIYFFHEGGIDVGDVDTKAERISIETGDELSSKEIKKLLVQIPEKKKKPLQEFISKLFACYQAGHFVYMEINPIVVQLDGSVHMLDLAAKLDETAHFLVHEVWGTLDFPAAFGRSHFEEENYIRDLDSRTGASLKLTVLNIKGRIWPMVAGGGASVVFADTVCDYNHGDELAIYGEYSGAPSAEETFQYAKTIFQLMTRYKRPEGKILLIGGGIANFTDVSKTFAGLIKAIVAFQEELKYHEVAIWVRRAGLNYCEGLRHIKEAVKRIGLPIHVYGPETHVTSIVPMSLGICPVKPELDLTLDPIDELYQKKKSFSPCDKELPRVCPREQQVDTFESHPHHSHSSVPVRVASATRETTCIVYNLQKQAVQRMLDFDHMCRREKPSVSCVVFPFGGESHMIAYWGSQEIFIPIYTTIDIAVENFPDASVMISFASFRSVFDSTMKALEFSSLKTIAIIAEGVPELHSRIMLKEAEKRNVLLIGPATVGGIKPGCFRIGNTGGALENLLLSRLYRPGSVAYVSRSGGMSNELNNIISRATDGVYEGVAIGGDRYPGSRFIDHVIRFQHEEGVKIIVLLGEVGGVDEYDIVEAIQEGKVTKPVLAWCIGTCAAKISHEIQFGHAGAQARTDIETAIAKNLALSKVCRVPPTFDLLGTELKQMYEELVESRVIPLYEEPDVPQVPKDYADLKEKKMVRKPANFVCSISDEKYGEVQYCGKNLNEIFEENTGIGGVVSLLWYRRKLPQNCLSFIEIVLMLCADHGPAVSGAHNTIVCTRAGRDLVSSLCSGLLTIGPRFGGALDEAARDFSQAIDRDQSPEDFVRMMKKKNKLIMGIGHRVKTVQNPDTRVTYLKTWFYKNFTSHHVLNFALAVEKVTTSKKANLILNIDGVVACCFVDMIRTCGAFTRLEAERLVDSGGLNGLFVLSRSIGLIGHHLDQQRLNQPLYRHPIDDIAHIDAI